MKKEKIDLGTQTIGKLKAYIHDQDLMVGDKLPTETELVRILGVGRSTIREAIKILAYSQVLEVKQGSGTYVTAQPRPKISDEQLWLTQKMIETEAIRELVQIAVSDDEWLLLKAKLGRRNQLLQDGKFTAYLDADIAFHQMLVRMAKNDYLIRWYNEISTQWLARLSRTVVASDDYDGNTRLHNQLYEQLINRQAEAAVKTIRLVGGKDLDTDEA